MFLERTVSTPNGTAYLNVTTGNPSEQFRLASIADTTFIVNREKTVAMDTSNLSTNWASKGWSKLPTIQRPTASQLLALLRPYATGATGALSTITIATNLRNFHWQGDSNLSGFTFTAKMTLSSASPRTTALTTPTSASDTQQHRHQLHQARTVSAINDLPGISGAWVQGQVQGPAATSFDDYYVELRPTLAAGLALACGVKLLRQTFNTSLTGSTMPHVLV